MPSPSALRFLRLGSLLTVLLLALLAVFFYLLIRDTVASERRRAEALNLGDASAA